MAIVFFLVLFAESLFAETFEAHCRDRAPELFPVEKGCAGPVSEIIELALNRSGHDVHWYTVPWARTILEAEIGSVDIIPRHSMNSEREGFLNAVAYGYAVRRVYFMISPKIDIEINRFDDLNEHTVGALRGSFYSEKFAATELLNKQLFNDTAQLIKMLELGRIDVAVTSSSHDIDQFRAISGIKQAAFVDEFYNGRYVSIPKKSPLAKFFPKIESEINTMKRKGEIHSIFEKYSITPPQQK